MNKHFIIPVFVPHYGCPHDCVFCNQKKITGVGGGASISYDDVRRIIGQHLETIHHRAEKKQEETFVEVSFFGGSFTGIPIEQQRELLRAALDAKKQGLIRAIRLSTRPDYINKEILEHLQEFDVNIIELGVQSMVPEVLEKNERGHSTAQTRQAAALIHSAGFTLGLQMMTGLLADSPEWDVHTAAELIQLKPDFVRIYPTLVIRDTVLEAKYSSLEYKSQSVEEAVELCKKLYGMFLKSDIPVIRIGLQPTDAVTLGKEVVSGPFHPAFRELVEGSLLNDQLFFMVEHFFQNERDLEILVNPRDISKLFADKKRYFTALKSRYPFMKWKITQCSTLERDEISIIGQDNERKMSLYEFLLLEN